MIGLFHCLASLSRPALADSLVVAPLGAAEPPGTSGAQILIYPPVILLLCVVAGLGTVLLLPSRIESPLRKIGGTLVFTAVVIFGAQVVHQGGVHFYFWIFAFIALLGAIRVVTHRRPVYSALYFVLTVLATAGLFILLWAEFMAAALILIYAGAILITYVFVIMLASQSTGQSKPLKAVTEYDAVSREPLVAAAVGFALMGMLLFVIFDTFDSRHSIVRAHEPGLAADTLTEESDIGEGSTQSLGRFLFTNHLINLELAGLILTISTVGAIVIARRRVASDEDAFEPTTETYVAPATPIDDNPHSIPVYGTMDPRQKEYPET